jgi:hypothetical protein
MMVTQAKERQHRAQIQKVEMLPTPSKPDSELDVWSTLNKGLMPTPCKPRLKGRSAEIAEHIGRPVKDLEERRRQQQTRQGMSVIVHFIHYTVFNRLIAKRARTDTLPSSLTTPARVEPMLEISGEVGTFPRDILNHNSANSRAIHTVAQKTVPMFGHFGKTDLG